MYKHYHSDLTDTELNLCLIGKEVKYASKEGISKNILVAVHGETLYFRKKEVNADTFAVEGAKVFHHEHDFITINKTK